MSIDSVIASLAVAFHGVTSWDRLRAAPLDARAVRRRVAAGLVEALSPRVLKIAAAPWTPELRIAAATLDVPGGAVASFETAAWLWGLPGFPLRGVEVTARRTQHRTSSLAFVHQPVLLIDEHITVVRGIPVTTLPRTIFDLAGVIHPRRLERLVDSVITRSPAMLPALHRLLMVLAKRGRPGIRAMRTVLAARPVGTKVAASGYEARFEEVLSNAGISGLRRQVDVGGHTWVGRFDYLDDVTGVVFEIDSAEHHTSRTDLDADAKRDAAAIASGIPEVVRIATEDLFPRPDLVVAKVREVRSRHRRTPDVAVSRHENAS